MRAWIMVAVLLGGCSSPPPAPRVCSPTLPCPPPEVCDPVQRVCVRAREGGWTSAWELGGPDLGAIDWHDPRLTEAGCPSPQKRCGGVCVDTQTSVAHCGACDQACAPSYRCLKGVCKPPGQASWTGCAVDEDCASLVCGCNGGVLTSKQCLPSALYPRDCGWANWTGCTVDSDCASHWCGCNGGKLKQCLPSTLYPKSCS